MLSLSSFYRVKLISKVKQRFSKSSSSLGSLQHRVTRNNAGRNYLTGTRADAVQDSTAIC